MNGRICICQLRFLFLALLGRSKGDPVKRYCRYVELIGPNPRESENVRATDGRRCGKSHPLLEQQHSDEKIQKRHGAHPQLKRGVRKKPYEAEQPINGSRTQKDVRICRGIDRRKIYRKVPKLRVKRVTRDPLIGVFENIIVEAGVSGIGLYEREARQEGRMKK